MIGVHLIVLGAVTNEGWNRHRAIVKLQRAGIGLFFEHQGARTRAYDPNARPPGWWLAKRVCGEYSQSRVIQIEVVPPAKFTDSDCQMITVFKELDWLAASGTQLTDEGLKHLGSITNLGRLDVEQCRVTKQGVARLRRALPNTAVYSDFDIK